MQAVQALALLRGRDYVLPGDVADLAVDVLAHRLVLTYEALADDVPGSRSLVRQVLERRRAAAGRAVAGRGGVLDRSGRRVSPLLRRRPPAPPARARAAGSGAASGGCRCRSPGASTGCCRATTSGSLPGPGSEPAEARAYAPGDDVRRIDWAVTARTGDPHVRQAVAERELETTLLVDLTASMAFGTARSEKRDLALAAAAAFAHLAAGPGDRLGAVVLRRRRSAASPPGPDGAAVARAAARPDAPPRPVDGRRPDAGASG